MIHCDKCKTVNPPELQRCQNCGKTLLPGRGACVRIGVLAVALGFAALAVFILVRTSQGGDMPDLGCAFTSPIFWIIVAVLSPIMGLVYALQRTPKFESYVDRAKRHLQLDPDQALADFNQALTLAPEKEKAAILKQRAALLEKLGQTTDATRDKLAAMESAGAYSGAEGFASLIGVDKDTYVGGIKSGEQQALVKSKAAVGLGWCKKCKKAVQLDEKMKCPLHPNTRISDLKLVVPEDAENELFAMQELLKMQKKSLKVRRIVVIVVIVLILIVLCYFTNQ